MDAGQWGAVAQPGSDVPGAQIHGLIGYGHSKGLGGFSQRSLASKHYHPAANRALPAVIFGVVGQVGELNGLQCICPKDTRRAGYKKLLQRLIRRFEAANRLNLYGLTLPGLYPGGKRILKLAESKAVALPETPFRLAVHRRKSS